MRKIIVFPGQGFQNIEMLTSEVKEFCIKNGIEDLLNEVLKDSSKIFDTEYAQAIIVATQLAKLAEYKKSQSKDIEYIYAGFSLGEVTALIASGAISIEEGLNFARQRGKMSKGFSENSSGKRKFGVARISYYEAMKKQLSDFNSVQEIFDKINITNYIPDEAGKSFVTITGELNNLRDNIELFGGEKDQEIVIMQCPFHTSILSELIPIQKEIFDLCITNIDSQALEKIYNTRMCEFYSRNYTKENINNSLAEYLVQPIQTIKTLKFFLQNYPNEEIIVTMGKVFCKEMAEQYGFVGGKSEKVKFIDDNLI